MEFFALPLFQSALALVIVWAFFALACTFLHETVVQIKYERGKFLYSQLISMLDDRPNGINWGALMYQHGSFDLLSAKIGDRVSSISPGLFAKALVNVVCNSSQVQLAMGGNGGDLWALLQKAPSVFRGSDVMDMLRLFIHEAEVAGTTGPDAIAHVQKGVADWYTQYESEMTDRYKQLSKKRLFALGMLLALFINLDSIQVFKHLVHNPKATASIISYYKTNEVLLDTLNGSLKQGDNARFMELIKQPEYQAAIRDGLKEKDGTLPFVEPFWFKHPAKYLNGDFTDIILKLIGFLVTGFAASLGAPFWFDILKKAIKK